MFVKGMYLPNGTDDGFERLTTSASELNILDGVDTISLTEDCT